MFVQALKLSACPKTPIDALDCTSLAPWCEVVSGETLFYTDEAARYLFVGRLYDLEERRDVTATRLLELNPDLLARRREPRALRAAPKASHSAKPFSPHPPRSKGRHSRSLPHEGAIRWGNPKGAAARWSSPTFQCGYCQVSSPAHSSKGGRTAIEERPISIFGAASRRLSESVLCAQRSGRGAARCLYWARHVPHSRQLQGHPQRSTPTRPLPRPMALPGRPVIVRAKRWRGDARLS